MTWFKSLSIRNKLTLIILSVSVVIVLVLGAARIAWDVHQIRESLAEQLSSLSQLLGDRSSAALAFDDSRLATENLNALHTISYIVQACLYKVDGTVLGQYQRDESDSSHCPGIVQVNTIDKTFEVDRLHIATEIKQDNQSLGWIYLGSDFSLISARLENQFFFSGGALLLAIITAGLLAQRLQRLISRPIEAITTVARGIEVHGDNDIRAKIYNTDEVGQLANTFNNMLDALDNQNQQLRRNQKMDALGKLTGGIAHDYNNMLGIILGYAELLEENLVDQPKLANYAYEIRHAGERGTKLTQRLLAFSKQKHTDAQTTDINELLSNSKQMLEKTLTARVDLVLKLSDDLWPVWIDSSDLEDTIINLCINAMHAIEGTGRITVQTDNLSVSQSDSVLLQCEVGDYVVLNIIDTGSGMDKKTKERIFDPFFSTKGAKGTGLGLSQVYGFVERSGGAIKVYSEVGHGTRFSLYFPRGKHSASRKKPTQEITSQLSGTESILVVDDEPAMVSLATDILGRSGYRVFSANDGEQALLVLKKEKVDLVISDVIMPKMDGFQLITEVRKLYPTIRIQMVSGFSDDRHKDTADDELHKKMLHKPYTSKLLLEQVRLVLNEEIKDAKQVKNSLANKTVLVMDDDDDVRELFNINLGRLDCRILLAIDGDEAIQFYTDSIKEGRKIDIMILDLSIPNGRGGKETAEIIRAQDKSIKLIVSSGHTEGPEMTLFGDYGFNAAIEKNFNRKKMKEILEKVLNEP